MENLAKQAVVLELKELLATIDRLQSNPNATARDFKRYSDRVHELILMLEDFERRGIR